MEHTNKLFRFKFQKQPEVMSRKAQDLNVILYQLSSTVILRKSDNILKGNQNLPRETILF